MRIEDAVPDPTRALATLHDEVNACTACELHRCSVSGVVGSGQVPAPLMLVTGAPTEAEVRAGGPLTGGTLPDEVLRATALEFHPRYVTHAVKHPVCGRTEPPAAPPAGPTVEQVRACSRWLARELELVDPEVVVLFGESACWAAAALLDRDLDPATDHGRAFSANGRKWMLVTDITSDLRAVSDLLTPDPGS